MKYISILFLFVFTLAVHAQKSLPDHVEENIAKRIEYELNPGIAIGIVDETGSRAYVFGANSLNGAKSTRHSIYEIGSISKVFTAILLADQVLKGNMSLDDPISKYLPAEVDVPEYNGQSITLGHLSDHTSSLPRMPDNFAPADPDNPYADYTPELLYDFLSRVKLTREIGSEYEYSNLAQGLLGHILELKTGKTYEQLLREIITGPLGMNETRVALDQHMQKNLAIGYNDGQETPNWDIATLTGAGGIRSSVHDMMLFLSANLGLTTSSLAQAMNVTHQARHDKAGNVSVGLGWHIRIDREQEQEYITHNGATGGYRAFSAINKKKKLGVVVLTNSNHGADDIGRFLMGASDELDSPRRDIASLLREQIDKNGIETAINKCDEIKSNNDGEYTFEESSINALGYYYMNQDKLDVALKLFELNIREHPAAFNVYDSYAEALMNKSIANYKKSIELNPNNQNGYDMLAKMGVDLKNEDVEVSPDILETYVGTYQLAPSFAIDITHREGQLFAQATGQSMFEIFPTSDHSFYFKVVDAQIEFNTDETGKVTGLTLYQGGAAMPGEKTQ